MSSEGANTRLKFCAACQDFGASVDLSYPSQEERLLSLLGRALRPSSSEGRCVLAGPQKRRVEEFLINIPSR